MNELVDILLVLAGVMAVNAVWAAVLWARQKTPLYRALLLVWVSALFAAMVRGTFQTWPLTVFAFGVSSTLLNLALADLMRRALDLRVRWGAYLLGSLAGLLLGGAAAFASAPFWLTSLPVAIGTASSLLHVVYQALRRPPGVLRITGGAVTLSVLLLALHQLDYPFLRGDPRMTMIAFFIAIILLFAISATAPAVILEREGSQRKEMEEEVRRLNRLLEARIEETLAAVKGRDEFLSIASHELRTPLTALRLQIRLAQQNPPGGMPQAERLRVIERQSARLEALVNQLLDVSRVASRKLDLQYADIDLAAVTTDVADRMLPEIELVKSSLRVSVTAPLRGKWDAFRLEQVLVNLLANAVKFGPGEPIEIRLEDDGEGVRLTVRDHGIGVKPEDQSRIFLPFERANPVREYGGLGLGLWIAAQIIEAHGGTIQVNSPLGAGAEFTVRLPKTPPGFSLKRAPS